MTDAPAPVAIPTVVTEWLQGSHSTAPDEVRDLMNNVTEKMNCFVALVISKRLTKVDTLVTFIEKCEESMYKLELIEDLALVDDDYDKIKKLHSHANARLTELLEFTRKFTLQNKEFLFSPTNELEGEIAGMLRSMNVDQLTEMKSWLQEKKQLSE